MRSSCSLLVALVCGCNQIYGLEQTRPVDAAYYDAPADAPYACPPVGTPPRFSRTFTQALIQPCSQYTVSITGRAMAQCPPLVTPVITEAAIGERLEPAKGFDVPGYKYDLPRLGPDGNVAVVHVYDGTRDGFFLFDRTDTGWTKRSEITLPPSRIFAATAPTRNGRLIVVVPGGGLRELADDGNGSYTEVAVHTFTQLEITSLTQQLYLTADGLRLVFGGAKQQGPQLLYADRPTIADPFSPAVPMPNVEYLTQAFMTEDCSRLYFSGLDNIFYTEPG